MKEKIEQLQVRIAVAIVVAKFCTSWARIMYREAVEGKDYGLSCAWSAYSFVSDCPACTEDGQERLKAAYAEWKADAHDASN